MTLQQVTYFLAAAEHGSFSAAAKSLFLAQPSVSEQVRQLEGELGVRLFARVGRGLVLTEAGRAFRREAERIVAAVDAARETVAEVRELHGGTASFGTLGTASRYFLADLVGDFRERYPDVRIRVVGQNSSQVADAIRAGRLEAGLIVLPIDDEALDVRPWFRDEVLFVSATRSRVREPMTIERLAETPLILYDASYGSFDPTRRQLAERAQAAGVALAPVIEIEDLEGAIALAARGHGDTIVPRAALLAEDFPRNLRSVPFAEPMYDTFAFVTRRGAPLSPATRALLELAEERLAGLRARLGQ